MKMYFCLFLMISLFACRKDDNATDITIFNGTFSSSNLIIYDSVRMYTAAGVISDTQLIHNYIKRPDMAIPASLFAIQPATVPVKYDLTINLNKGQTGRIPTLSTQSEYDIVKKTDNISLMLRKDSTFTFSSSPQDETNLNCQSIWQLADEYPVTGVFVPLAGGGYQKRAREQFVIARKGTELQIPLMTYHFSRKSDGSPCGGFYGNKNGVFNQQLPAQLQPGDTLLVQTYRLRMARL